MSASLLIVDEFGYQTFDRQESNLFFRVVNHRYQRGSIAITTNKGVASWPEVLADDEVLAGAILDRLLHCATVLNTEGGATVFAIWKRNWAVKASRRQQARQHKNDFFQRPPAGGL